MATSMFLKVSGAMATSTVLMVIAAEAMALGANVMPDSSKAESVAC